MGYNKVKSFLRSSITLAITVSLLLSTVGITNIATAATPKATPVPSRIANSMSISPLRSDITVAPGETEVVTVTITNLSPDTVTLQPIENDFVAGDEKGTPAIILDQNSYAPTHSLKRFMMPLSNVTLGPKASAQVKLTINVPLTAQAGGYFGALRFAPATKGNQPVSLSSSVVSLVLLTVPGPTVEKLELTDFDVQQNGKTGTNFRNPDNLNLLVRFRNDGSVQQAPFGDVTVLKGKQVVYTYKFNQVEPKGVVLPDSARRWEVPLKNMGKFGKYTIRGTFGYGNGQSVDVRKTIWIVPLAYILGAIGALLVLGLIIFLLILVLKGRRRSSSYRSRR